MTRLPLLFVTLLLQSCSYASLSGFPIPTAASEGKIFFVRHQVDDDRALDVVLADALRARGIAVANETSDSPDYVVSYIDKWYWDMRTYLIDFRIDVRDAQTEVLLGTSRSFQTSLDAMGKSYQQIIETTLSAALDGLGQELEEEPTSRRRSKSRSSARKKY